MFIKKLILNGFKAFADKTVLNFSPGISGLIGPNGCGKSNIIDAIRWVLGEQKATELRGNKIEDVIFHGGENKKSNHFAEVEIVLDNSQIQLPLEYSEISIMRRFYRSGEGEYFINKKSCRLKDIHNLLLDTGIGKNSYSVIEQGKIDRLLSKNHYERRIAFEESASIGRYREQKKEYLNKINKAQDNLTRANDIIKEKMRRSGQLKVQVEESDKYFALNKKLKEYEIDFLLYRLIKFKEKKKEKKIVLEKFLLEEKKNQQSFAVNKEKITGIEEQIKGNKTDVDSLEKERISLQEKIFSNDKTIHLLKEQNQQREQDVVVIEKDVVAYLKQKEEYQVAIDETLKQIEKIEIQIKENKEKIENNRAEEKKISEEKTKLSTEKDTLLKRAKQIKNEQREIQSKHDVLINDIINEIDKLKAEVVKEQESYENNKKELIFLQNDIQRIVFKIADTQISFENKNKLGDFKKLLLILKKETNKYYSSFDKFIKQKDPFFQLIFSSEGAYAKKEKMDNTLHKLNEELISNEKYLERIEKTLSANNISRESLNKEYNQLSLTQSTLKQENHFGVRNKNEKQAIINNIHTKVESLKKRIKITKDKLALSYEESKKQNKTNSELISSKSKVDKKLQAIASKVGNKNEQLQKLLKTRDSLESKLSQVQYKKLNLEKDVEIINHDIQGIFSLAKEQFSENLEEQESQLYNKRFDINLITNKRSEFKKELSTLKANPLAKEEYQEITAEIKNIEQQKEDIKQSISDLENIIAEVDEKSEELFLTTFNKIKENFHNLFRRLFQGGKATLYLEEEKNPLNCGIGIKIQPPGKNPQNINLFSGGEKSLIAIALMLSIFMVKPSPLCLLDEVDAALDRKNIGRLVRLFSDFKEVTQFIIISHNEATMEITDSLYGVTMNEGISKIFSLRFDQEKKKVY